MCPRCGSDRTDYVVVEETKEGYVWEAECNDCGWDNTGYEF